MKIGFFELEKWEEEYIKEKLKGHKLYFYNSPLDVRNANKAEDVDVIACFIYSEVKKEILSKLKKLKFVTTMSTGFDHIDVEYCKKRRIKVSNVPSYGENTVAEFTFALILALSRRIHTAIEKTRKDDFSLKGLMGFDLKNKVLGVIGPGHIGQHVIRIANGFEMNVVAYGVKKDFGLSKKLGFKWVNNLNELLRKSDIITIHVPLIKETKHLINMNNINNIKAGSYLINTSRGEIIDTSALLYGLEKGIIAGAALDVLEGECDIKEEKELLHGKKNICDLEIYCENRLLLKDKNVIVTPHCAFYTKEALERILDETASNIIGFVKGKFRNRVV